MEGRGKCFLGVKLLAARMNLLFVWFVLRSKESSALTLPHSSRFTMSLKSIDSLTEFYAIDRHREGVFGL